MIDDYFDTYKGIREYMDRDARRGARKRLRRLRCLAGGGISRHQRPQFLVRSRAEREAINMPIQGTASDIVKIAMITY